MNDIEIYLQASEYFTRMADITLNAIDPYLTAFFTAANQMPQLPEICAVVLAFSVLLLCRRIRRTRAAMRGMAAELEQYRQRFAEADKKREATEERIARMSSELAEQRGRMRGIEARVGKPDPQLASAMARAGTRSQDMVECGLSHGEVHLLQALNSARSGPAEMAAG